MVFNQVVRQIPRWLIPALSSVLIMPISTSLLNTPSLPTQHAQLRPSREEPIDSSTRNAAAFAIAAVGIGVVGLSWKASRSTSSSRKLPASRSISQSQQRKLLSLLHNDHRAAERLIQQVQIKHPERSLDWCVEKVIYDLQRDRHFV